MADDRELQALRALASAARAIGRGTTSTRVALAHAHSLLDPGLLPEPVHRSLWPELEEATAQVAPLAIKEVEKVLEAAWGGKPSSELDELDPSPAVVNAATQTHRGVRDGSAVAVTVLRPGLADLVRADLALIDRLVAPARAAFPAVDIPAIVREIRHRVLDDLDLEHVASAQRTLFRALRRDEELAVASPHTDLSHPGVLVRDDPQGTPVLELTDGAQRERAARLIVRFVAGSARHGTLVADLRPETVLLDADGRLVVLEASGVAPVPAARADAVADALDAIAQDDTAAGARAIVALGALPPAHASVAVDVGRALLGPLATEGPVRVDVAAARAAIERAEAHEETLLGLFPHAMVVPADLWPLRALGQAAALVTRLGAEVDWLGVARHTIRSGW